MRFFFIVLIFSFQIQLSAEPMSSKTLKVKDYGEMQNLLKKYIKSSQSKVSDKGEGEDEALENLTKGLKILLMRPNSDGPQDSLISLLQNEIVKYQSFMTTLHSVVKTSLKEFQSKKGSKAYQASLLYILENTLSYLQAINNKESNRILKDIKRAKLEISESLFDYLLLEMGRGKTATPSYLAEQILEIRLKEKKKELQEARKRKKARKEVKKSKKDTRNPASKKSEEPLRPTIYIDL